MDALSAHTSVSVEDVAQANRARARLYVILQVVGWTVFIVSQIVFTLMFKGSPKDGTPPTGTWVYVVMWAFITGSGFLMSHFMRRYIRKWHWKDLGWRGLIPRILLTALVLSVIWHSACWVMQFGVLRVPWKSEYSPYALFVAGCLQLSVIYVLWFILYFLYHFSDRFNRSEIERLSLTATVKDAELRALKSQVNPHFIFNSLNSLRALIDEDPARARQAVTQLANLLRYSLQSGQLETVPFEDELHVVNDYLSLEQVRHEERLRLRMDIAPDTLQVQIPPMLLQTLVENAVKYGISTRPEGGEIVIVSRLVAGAVRIEVINPGKLGDSLAQRGSGGNRSTGLGLKNAGDRLRLLFGEKATLQLRAGGPDSVVAEAVIPFDAVAKDVA